MKTIRQIQDYLKNEKRIASPAKASPEYQLFQALEGLAEQCQTGEEFCQRVRELTIEGDEAETREAREWIKIMLDSIINE